MALPRHVITLKGTPEQNEDGVAGAAITPGMLVSGTLTILPQGVAAANAPRKFALERQEMGKTIDDAYAIGDTVKVGSYAPGDRVYALIAPAQVIAIDAKLEAAADGTLRLLAAGTPLAFALEAVTAGVANTRIRVEVM